MNEPSQRPFNELSKPVVLLLSHAATDLSALAKARTQLPAELVVGGCSLQSIAAEEAADPFLTPRFEQARIVVLRVLGKPSSIQGFTKLLELCKTRSQYLVLLSGTGEITPELAALSSVEPSVLADANRYLHEGGPHNLANLCRFLCDRLLLTGWGYSSPTETPQHGIYHRQLGNAATWQDWSAIRKHDRAAGIVFYRAHYLAGNLHFIDALVEALDCCGLDALPVFTSSLKSISDSSSDQESVPDAFRLFFEKGERLIDVLINTTSFAMADVKADGPTMSGWSVDALALLNTHVLQAICSSMTLEHWQNSTRGLNPLDAAMNVVMPEFDGRITTVPISFKETDVSDGIETSTYVPVPSRIKRLADLASRMVRLGTVNNKEKRVAFILTNASSKAAQIGNAVGLDSPASLMRTLAAMKERGYTIKELPKTSDQLMHNLIDSGSYDHEVLTDKQCKQALGRVSTSLYGTWFAALTESQRHRIAQQWGPPPGSAYLHEGDLIIAGLDLGNVVLLMQPPRGYGMDPNAIYHQPDLPPTHHYLAVYRWLRDVWKADAIVHMGKHGTLEWLPGKATGLSDQCFPDTLISDLPLFYPFIINDPGEGAQAKRRSHAIIIDHLTPPMTTADTYGVLTELVQLVDEYYQLEIVDPAKLPLLQEQIWNLIQEANLQYDLQQLLERELHEHEHEHEHEHHHQHEHEHVPDGVQAQEGALAHDSAQTRRQEDPPDTSAAPGSALSAMTSFQVSHLIQEIDGYLCELGAAQIRDGLHILGNYPRGEQMVDMLTSLTRLPNIDVPSLQTSVAEWLGLSVDELLGARGDRLKLHDRSLDRLAGRPIITNADALETVDLCCQRLFSILAEHDFDPASIDQSINRVLRIDGTNPLSKDKALASVRATLTFACKTLVPKLIQSESEIFNLLNGLEGRYVPAGPSGAPTRGMAHVLPTGRNFYAVDPHTLPSQSAWRVGEQLAGEVLKRFRQETGRLPEHVSISMWGTSAMRTHGDDVAEVLALLGVRPLWHPENRRLKDLEVIPLHELGRARIDVTVRISGFFRDAFPNLIDLLDRAFNLVISQDESLELNFPRKHFLGDINERTKNGMPPEQAQAVSAFRIFGSKPGTYGCGILPLIQERNWQSDSDFAEAYINWGGYAYTGNASGIDARAEFCQLLGDVEVALHNQDNREHDIFDSDDYFQFHGGMLATIRSLKGKAVRGYFGDTQDPARINVRDIKSEAVRVFRSRVVNPKWIDSIKKHGYKGALELAATTDYLFGYDATAGVMESWMYQDLAQAYIFDQATRAFLEESNPWALTSMSERLLEAIDRGMWKDVAPAIKDALTQILLHNEASLEARDERPKTSGGTH